MRFYKPFLLNLSARSIWQKWIASQTHGAGAPEAWGHQRRGAQCNRIGCIGLRPALFSITRKNKREPWESAKTQLLQTMTSWITS